MKLRVKSALPGEIVRRMRPNAIRTLPRPSGEVHGGGIPLFALVATWNEEDIIYAAVRNAFDLGAERVFLIDNDSSDGTIDEATAAGATHVMSFITDSYDEVFRCRLMNEQLHQLARNSEHDRIWWMVMDADEFSSPPPGESLPDLLAMMDRRCRVVGARVLDHYPTPGRTYVTRTHPLAVQRMCREKVDQRCELGHHKHPIFLWDRNRPEIEVEPGFHQVRCAGEALYEPDWSVIMHHFPFRSREVSRRRLELLASRGFSEQDDVSRHDHVKSRMSAIDAVYEGRYEDVPDHLTGKVGLELSDWNELINP